MIIPFVIIVVIAIAAVIFLGNQSGNVVKGAVDVADGPIDFERLNWNCSSVAPPACGGYCPFNIKRKLPDPADPGSGHSISYSIGICKDNGKGWCTCQ